jgi:stress response protein YsnF
MKEQTVIGIFDYGVDAQMAAQKLMKEGIPDKDIDLAVNGLKDKADDPQNMSNRNDNKGTDRFFGSIFDNKDESRKYSEVAQHGAVLTVHAHSQDEAKRAADLLDKCGAIDVDDRAEKYRNMPKENRAKWINSNASIPVVEEKMQVGKREVETGGVHMRSRIVERPVEEHLRLREEHVNVERRPVNRPANEEDMKNFKNTEATFTEHAEVPVVNKEARVVEEVRLNKETTERNETIRGTERKQDVEIDKLKGDRDQRDQTNRGPKNI